MQSAMINTTALKQPLSGVSAVNRAIDPEYLALTEQGL